MEWTVHAWKMWLKSIGPIFHPFSELQNSNFIFRNPQINFFEYNFYTPTNLIWMNLPSRCFIKSSPIMLLLHPVLIPRIYFIWFPKLKSTYVENIWCIFGLTLMPWCDLPFKNNKQSIKGNLWLESICIWFLPKNLVLYLQWYYQADFW